MLGSAKTAWQARAWASDGGYTNPLTTWTALGAAQLSTAQYKFGTASMYTNSNQAATSGFEASSGDRTFMNVGTGDFTISFWARLTSSTSTTKWQDIMANNTAGGLGFRFGTNYGAGSPNGLNIFARTQADLDYCNFTWSTDTWYWIVIQRSGTTISFWVDGTQVTTQGSGAGTRNFANWASGNQITFGNAQDSDGSQFVYFDELNITVGSALYPASGSLTVPTAPFTVQQYTKQLVHWDGANGATTVDNDQG